MSTSESAAGNGRLKRWALIAAGYAGSLAAGLVCAWAFYAAATPDMLQQSGGMVAGGQMIVFLGTAGFTALFPSYFLLKELGGAAWLWPLLAGGGASAALGTLLVEAVIVAAFLGGGHAYHYPDPAFFNLDWLAWFHYKAPFKHLFFLSPPVFAASVCLWLAAPAGGARRVLGWSALAALSGVLFLALSLFLVFHDKAVHP